MALAYILLTVAAGIALSVQIGVNNALRTELGNPIVAALFSFIVGAVFLLCYALIARTAWPSFAVLVRAPLWVWLGGVLGAYYVLTMIYAAPQLGAASLISIVVAAQLITSLILDHYGLIGFAQHGITVWRLLGAGLLIGGVLLIVKT